MRLAYYICRLLMGGAITLLSDFGTQDATLASVKGIFLQNLPQVPIIDISHSVKEGVLIQAAYLLLNAYKYFPERTCHVVFYDLFAFNKKCPEMLLCKKDNHFFIAPNNHILPLAFDNKVDAAWLCYQLKEKENFKDWIVKAAEVIHTIRTEEEQDWGFEPYAIPEAPAIWQPTYTDDKIIAKVCHIDNFGNVVLNVRKPFFEQLARQRSFRIVYGRNMYLDSFVDRHNQSEAGVEYCRFNSSDFMEICMYNAKAASLLGLSLFKENSKAIFKEVIIEFYDSTNS